MKKAIGFILIMFSFSELAFARLGPFPHERTDTPKKKNAHVGRYLYIGSAPSFETGDVELTISKMSLTVRATAWVKQDKIDNYAKELYERWLKIEDALKDPKFVLHPLIKLESLATAQTSIAWAKIASQYSSHVLENRGVEVYQTKRNAKNVSDKYQYSENISDAILRYLFKNNRLNAHLIKSDNKLRDSLLSVENSRRLFSSHHQDNFTKRNNKTGFVGHITYVYPIAATVKGPFNQPKEASRTLMSYGTIEARWWSDRWADEFGGLPFILINSAGVAFHGPISNFAPLDVWFLRRGYVSHGCHRMDVSDLMELRSILPKNVKELGKVKLTILDYFDVTDWDNDGKSEVVDVKYYNIPNSVSIPKGKTIDEVIRPYKVENQAKSFFANNSFAKKFYDVQKDMITGTPKYQTEAGILKKVGTYGPLPIKRFDYKPSRVLQYQELGTQLLPYDDNKGKFPPTYFY